jgi:hypothetical protein
VLWAAGPVRVTAHGVGSGLRTQGHCTCIHIGRLAGWPPVSPSLEERAPSFCLFFPTRGRIVYEHRGEPCSEGICRRCLSKHISRRREVWISVWHATAGSGFLHPFSRADLCVFRGGRPLRPLLPSWASRGLPPPRASLPFEPVHLVAVGRARFGGSISPSRRLTEVGRSVPACAHGRIASELASEGRGRGRGGGCRDGWRWPRHPFVGSAEASRSTMVSQGEQPWEGVSPSSVFLPVFL